MKRDNGEQREEETKKKERFPPACRIAEQVSERVLDEACQKDEHPHKEIEDVKKGRGYYEPQRDIVPRNLGATYVVT